MARASLGNRIATLVATRFRLYVGPGSRERALWQAILISLAVLIAALCFMASLDDGEPFKFLLQTTATICLSVLGLCFVFYLLLMSAEEGARINRSACPAVPEELSLRLEIPTRQITIVLDRTAGYEMPPWLAVLLKSLPFDLQEYYALHAGSVDFPKIRLTSIEREAGTLRFVAGSTSYIDHFYTHLFFDFLLAGGKDDATSLRSVLSEDAESHYITQIRDFAGGRQAQLKVWPEFPGTLGITALVVAKMPSGKRYCFFKQRTDDVVAHARAIQSTLAFTYNTMRAQRSSNGFPLTGLVQPNYVRNFVTPFCDAVMRHHLFCDAFMGHHLSPTDVGVRRGVEETVNSWVESATAKAITFGPALGYQPEVLILIEGELTLDTLPAASISRIERRMRRNFKMLNGKALVVEDHDVGKFVRQNELAEGANRIRPVDLELIRRTF